MAARYSSVAVALHWAIAILILGQIAGGFYMHNLPNSDPSKFGLFQLHKSFGLSIFILTAVRLVWRLMHRPPPLPGAMPGWQKIAARATHWGFYGLLFATPLVGLAMVSVSPTGIPTVYFGLVGVPHLPFFDGVADRGAAEDLFKEAHEFLAYAMLFLLALHVAAALKHGLFDRDGVLRSIAPAGAGAWIGIVAIFGVLGVGAAFYGSQLFRPTLAEPVEADRPVAPIEQRAEEPPAESAPTAEAGAEDTGVAETTEPADDVAEEPVVSESAPAAAPPNNDQPNWIVDYGASALRFIGEEKGDAFEGRFSEFSADIFFDPDFLELSWINIEVRTASGATGDQLRDTTIAGGDWFDVKDHPTAQFSSSAIRQVGESSYEADGQLAIKGLSAAVMLAFDLSIDGDNARAMGGANLMRTDFGLGADASWLEEENVALAVRVEFEIVATRGP